MKQRTLTFDRTAPGELLIEVDNRFDEAGLTLARLPGAAITPSMLEVLDVEDLPDELEPPMRRPTAAEISRMDETFLWLSCLPPLPDAKRLLVLKRLVRNARTGAHRYSWRRLGAALHVSHHTAKAWHAEAIRTIAIKLTEPSISTSHIAQNQPSVLSG